MDIIKRHNRAAANKQTDPRLSDFFGDLLEKAFSDEPATTSGTYPAVNLSEDEGAYRLTVELPGVEEKDIHITFSGDTLLIKGEKQHEEKRDDEHFHIVERSYGSFARSISFPVSIDHDKVTAGIRHGILTIVVPKAPTAKAKRIDIVSKD